MAEMTEASDRIHSEVGEDADIIWGTVLDDNIENELRVTVIATGIGTKEEEDVIRTSGKVRDITQADLTRAVDLDQPTFIRQEKAVGESGGRSCVERRIKFVSSHWPLVIGGKSAKEHGPETTDCVSASGGTE
jgi:hypothetical protein